MCGCAKLALLICSLDTLFCAMLRWQQTIVKVVPRRLWYALPRQLVRHALAISDCQERSAVRPWYNVLRRLVRHANTSQTLHDTVLFGSYCHSLACPRAQKAHLACLLRGAFVLNGIEQLRAAVCVSLECPLAQKASLRSRSYTHLTLPTLYSC